MPVRWFDNIELTVEAGLSAATGSYAAWDSSLWNTGTWGPDTIWTDISPYVRSINTQRRFARDLQQWETGSARVELKNSDGRFSPTNMSSPYITAGVSGVRPWRPIRIKVQGVPIWTGYVLSWDESYSRAHATATVVADCRDEFASLARFDGFETTEQGAGETTGRRIHRVLDSASHTGDRAVDVGYSTCQATNLSQNALGELKLVADSEGGAVWVEADGAVWFASRYALIDNTRSRVIQATFGDGTNDAELPCMTIETSNAGEELVNIVSFARAGGTAHIVGDATSRALYGDAPHQRHDLVLEADGDVEGVAQLYVATHKDAEYRIEKITFSPRRRDYQAILLYRAILQRVRDLIRVNVRPAGGHTITRDCFISGISHTITPQGEWVVTWDLASASPWTGFSTSVFGTGVWDTATWFI
jgi:hypothetical protein